LCSRIDSQLFPQEKFLPYRFFSATLQKLGGQSIWKSLDRHLHFHTKVVNLPVCQLT
jgi:hypothetical protein